RSRGVRKKGREGGAAASNVREERGDPAERERHLRGEAGDRVPGACDEGKRTTPLDPDSPVVDRHVRAGKKRTEADATIGIDSRHRSDVDLERAEERDVGWRAGRMIPGHRDPADGDGRRRGVAGGRERECDKEHPSRCGVHGGGTVKRTCFGGKALKWTMSSSEP